MLKKKYRLNSRTKIKHFRSFTTPYFILRNTENNLEYNRFGFIVSKQVDKRAVIRNRVKRSFRLCIENVFDQIKSEQDMLFILKKEVLLLKPKELCLFIKEFFKKEGFIR